ncbi:MAG: hypothetical protein GEU75_03835 [Dehalococcoidia bacterium]|nr:hypothetical protein [Dehalococcoidia bacterium]
MPLLQRAAAYMEALGHTAVILDHTFVVQRERRRVLRESEQLMTKMRLRRLLEEILDSQLVQLDLEEDEEPAPESPSRPVKRVTLVARYHPA